MTATAQTPITAISAPFLYTPLPPTPSADEMLLALSHIVLRCEYRPPYPPRHTNEPSSQKHLELLNLLSLLLVTQAKGDVAAVMFRVLSKVILELHYAKNRPCSTDETAYIHDIFTTVRDMTSDVSATCWTLLSSSPPANAK